MTILITGARGKVGQAVVSRLHAAGRTVRAGSARPSELTVPAGTETAELVLDRPETFASALRGVRQVFLYPEPAGIHELIEAAEHAGVEHVVLLSSSSVTYPGAEDEPLAHHNAQVERALAGSGIAHTFLRPGAFAGNALGWSHAIAQAAPVRLAYPEAHSAVIHSEDIADIAVEALTGDSLTGRAVTLTGPESLTFRDQLAVIGSVLGREIPVEHITREEAEREMSAYVPAPVVSSLLNLWEATSGVPDTVADTTGTLLGRPARTFRQWARENAAAFGAR
ncbi:NAD(P)H-binding protein [Streptomyces sp. NPDC053048]|uniref:NAD(P)H-binding protein n=1 Tax=Streptomyces sp. NPDC053048 TaxID=3365694 RepID=UPI0037D3498F